MLRCKCKNLSYSLRDNIFNFYSMCCLVQAVTNFDINRYVDRQTGRQIDSSTPYPTNQTKDAEVAKQCNKRLHEADETFLEPPSKQMRTVKLEPGAHASQKNVVLPVTAATSSSELEEIALRESERNGFHGAPLAPLWDFEPSLPPNPCSSEFGQTPWGSWELDPLDGPGPLPLFFDNSNLDCLPPNDALDDAWMSILDPLGITGRSLNLPQDVQLTRTNKINFRGLACILSSFVGL